MTPAQAAQVDVVRTKAMQRDNWNAISSGWARWQDQFELGARRVTDRLIGLAGLSGGQNVLDVGTGIGEPALTAAATARHVTGVDLAPEMVAIARQRASGTGNVDFAVGDVESLEYPAGTYDVVLSRWGLMFGVDHDTTFRAVARVLAPGGVLAAAVWGPPAEVPVIALGFRTLNLLIRMPPPPPGTPGPFSMADPFVLRETVAAAGFTDVETSWEHVPFTFDSAEQFVGFTRAVTPPGVLAKVAEHFGTVDHPQPWAAVAQEAARYADESGRLTMPCTAMLLRAVVPS